MTKLSDTQAIILTAAAQRNSGSAYPLPATITAPKAAVIKAIAALMKRGLAEERETAAATDVARTDGDNRFGIYVTAAGLAAIGIADESRAEQATPTRAAAAPRATKAAAVLALLQREHGATLADLIAATGWLPHTARAALTCLRKKGHAIERSKHDGVTNYRIMAAA